MARIIAGARLFDLDDLCAEIGEQLRAPGSGEHPGEVENADAFEGKRHVRMSLWCR